MNKSELKTGMWVEQRDGAKGMVLLNTNNGDIITGDTWYPLDNVKDDLRNVWSGNYDIVKVYQPKSNRAYYNDELKDMKLLWERNEPKEITSEEAFSILKKHYGCEVKIKE